MKNPITLGLLAGIITSGLFLLVYYTDPKTMVSPFLYVNSILIYVFFMFQSIQYHKKFRNMIRNPFTVFLIANLIFHLFYYVLFSYIDPSLYDLQLEVMEGYLPASQPGVASEDSILDEQIGTGSLLFAYAKGAMGGFILSIIIGLIASTFKKV